MPETILSLYHRYLPLFHAAKIPSPNREILLLISHALGVSETYVHAYPETIVSNEHLLRISSFTERRLKLEPFAYIVGYQEFYSLRFYVNKYVLIPRPETEHLVEYVIQRAPAQVSILDIGSGSGCIPIAIATHRPDCSLTSIDTSYEAVEIAKNNALYHQLPSIRFEHIHGIEAWLHYKADWIVSNPPYIRSDEIPHLQEEVKSFEPQLALDGGNDGLFFYNHLSKSLRIMLNPGGKIVLEIGFDQKDAVIDIFMRHQWELADIVNDYSDYPRVLVFQTANLQVI